MGRFTDERPGFRTGLGKSDLPGLQGARGNVTLSSMTQCARLGSIPIRSRHFDFKLPKGACVVFDTSEKPTLALDQ